MNFFDMLSQIKVMDELMNFHQKVYYKTLIKQREYNDEELMFLEIMNNKNLEKYMSDPKTAKTAKIIVKYLDLMKGKADNMFC